MVSDPKSLAAEIEAVLNRHLVIVPGEEWPVLIGIPKAAAEIAALQSRAFEDGARAKVRLTPAQLRYLSRVSASPRPLGAIGAHEGAAERLVQMGLWTTEQVRSNHRDRTYYRITETGRAALAEQEKGGA